MARLELLDRRVGLDAQSSAFLSLPSLVGRFSSPQPTALVASGSLYFVQDSNHSPSTQPSTACSTSRPFLSHSSVSALKGPSPSPRAYS